MGKMGRWALRILPGLANTSLNPWAKQREMPESPKESFREWYLKNKHQ
jgi:L-lactate dehydrogenase complex protein LldF